MCEKLGEEGVELALASLLGDKEEICKEASDLLYHLLVVLEATQTPLVSVLDTLAQRMGISGLVEKAQRSKT